MLTWTVILRHVQAQHRWTGPLLRRRISARCCRQANSLQGAPQTLSRYNKRLLQGSYGYVSPACFLDKITAHRNIALKTGELVKDEEFTLFEAVGALEVQTSEESMM